MFDVGGSELLVIGIVALVVIGPKELPGLIRTAGNAMSKVRRMAAEFRSQFDEAMREAELEQAKKAYEDVKDMASSVKPAFNPLDTIRNEIQSVKDEITAARETAVTDTAPPAPEPRFDPPPPAPPVDIRPEPPQVEAAAPPVDEPAPAPRRTRKKSDDAGASA